MVNAVEGFGRGEDSHREVKRETKQPVFLVINNWPTHPEQLLRVIDQYRKLHEFAELYQFLR